MPNHSSFSPSKGKLRETVFTAGTTLFPHCSILETDSKAYCKETLPRPSLNLHVLFHDTVGVFRRPLFLCCSFKLSSGLVSGYVWAARWSVSFHTPHLEDRGSSDLHRWFLTFHLYQELNKVLRSPCCEKPNSWEPTLIRPLVQPEDWELRHWIFCWS